MLLGNPNMVGAILSCFLDNTVPGTFSSSDTNSVMYPMYMYVCI